MAKKSSSQQNIQSLILFKHKGRSGKKKTDKYLVKKVNKEDKITLINSLTPQGIHIRYSILLTNNKSETITDINPTILYPNILNFGGFYPKTVVVVSSVEDIQDKTNRINLKLNNLNGKSSEQLYLHFTPSAEVNSGEFITILKYKNKDGKEGELKSQSIKIHINELKIMPKIISQFQIREISQIPGMKRTLVSLGIGTHKKLNSKKIFETIKSLILSYNFQIITKDEEKGLLWFYGSESNSSSDILALSKIGSNFIEIMAYSINFIILSQFLYLLKKKIKEQLFTQKIIKPNIKLYELECVNCGESLPFFPKTHDPITCIKCSYEQIIW